MADVASGSGRTATAEPLNDFLNPNSMLTPGFAGGLTMMITTVICRFFELQPAYTGLAVSALFGALVLVGAASRLRKAIYYVLNTLIIFCVAMGSGNFAHNLEDRRQAAALPALVAAAHAEPAANGSSTEPEEVLREVEAIKRDGSLSDAQKLQELKRALGVERTGSKSRSLKAPLFKQWKF